MPMAGQLCCICVLKLMLHDPAKQAGMHHHVQDKPCTSEAFPTPGSSAEPFHGIIADLVT